MGEFKYAFDQQHPYLYGGLTVTFSTPLTNPLMHIVGLGGTLGNLGFSTELDLTTPGLSLTKIQGNTTLVVNGTQIKNANTSSITASCATNGAACGTIKINGSNIQSVSFKVYIRGDGGGTTWDSTTVHDGDQWLLGFSLPKTWSVSGKVFNDANGMSDNTVNGTGTGTAAGAQLYANLVEPSSGKIIGSVPVNSDGTYSFNGVPDGANVRVEVSTNQGTALTNAPTKALPANWSNTGENVGTGSGSDGTPDGAISFTVSSDVTNVDLGIRNLGPTAAGVSVGGRVTTATGNGIRNVVITMTDSNGNQRRTTTGSFGSYRFADVSSGETYIITASGKRFTFSQPIQVLNIIEDTNAVDFIANPQSNRELSEKSKIYRPF